MEIRFEPIVNLGTILHLLGVLGIIIGAYIKLTKRLDRMDMKLSMLWGWFKREHDINGDRNSNAQEESKL